MNKKYRRKSNNKLPIKMLKAITFIILALLAVFTGIFSGNILSSIDGDFAGSIEPENFKILLNESLPIINSVYNSGNVSTSVTDELKNLISSIFGFDINNPVSIINAQSPLFYTYYNQNLSQLNASNDGSTPEEFTIPDNMIQNETQDNSQSSAENGQGAAGGNQGSIYGAQGGTGSGQSGAGSGQGAAGNGQGDTGIGQGITGSGKGNTNGGQANTNGGQNSTNGGQNSTGNGQGNTGGSLVKESGTESGKPENGEAAQLEPASSIYSEEGSEKQEPEKLEKVASGKIVIQNETDYRINIDTLLAAQLKLKTNKKGPKVLVFHTHTTESYIKSLKDFTNNAVSAYSNDPHANVVRVGEELSQNLRKKFGIDVIHNGTVNGSYSKSLPIVTKILKSYPSIRIVIDLHRDGMSGNRKYRAVTKVNGRDAAQVMFVVGSSGIGLSHPNWKENLKLALRLQNKLNKISPGLARPIDLSKNRYNQHLSNGALIIEVGGDGNLMSECLESTKYLARAISEILSEN